MATITFTSDIDWIVPDENGTVTIRCYGGEGEDGSASESGEDNSSWSTDISTSGGSNGGYAEGDASVSPGDVLHVRIGGGGGADGGSYGAAGVSVSAQGGAGGNAASVRHGGSTVNDTIIGAGGGGGGAAVGTGYDHSGNADTAGSGAGGGNGQDGGSQSQTDTAGGGASGSYEGDDGSQYKRTRGGVGGTVTCGGGGGGGFNGGEGGDIAFGTFVSSNSDYTNIYGLANGGAGGDGYTGGVSSSSQQTSFHSGNARVEIEYTPTPNAPINSNAVANHQGPNIEVLWNIHDSITDGFYIYRSESSGFTPGSGNRIATINNGSATSYTDSTVDRGVEYFYKISAFESTSSNESDPSVETASTAGEVFKIDEGGTFTQYPIKYNDSGSWEFASELWVFSGGSGYSTSAYGSSNYGSSSTGGWEEQ